MGQTPSASVGLEVKPHIKEKIVVLNAVVPPYPSGIMKYSVISANVAIEMIRKASSIESYIGHEATAKLLSTLCSREIPVNRGMYTPKQDDVAIIVRLKKRLEKPEDVKNVSINDIEFGLIEYLKVG